METIKNKRMAETINGWFSPSMDIEDFLAGFSRAGGTHHSALVYGDVKDVILDFGRLMNWKVIEL
jgi:hypothetical protein